MQNANVFCKLQYQNRQVSDTPLILKDARRHRLEAIEETVPNLTRICRRAATKASSLNAAKLYLIYQNRPGTGGSAD